MKSINRINKFELLSIFLLIPFFPLQSISMLEQYNSLWTGIYNVLAVSRCSIAVVQIVLFCLEFKKPNMVTKGIGFFELCIFIACCFNGSITFQFSITNCLACFGFCCLCQRMDRKNETKFLDSMVKLFGFYAILGALSIFLFPNGFNHASQKQFAIFLLGSKNSAFFYYAIYIFLKVVQVRSRKKEIPSYLIVTNIVFMVSTIVCDSMNGFLMLFLTLVFLIMSKYKIPFRKLFRPKVVLIILIIMALMIPFLASGKFDWFFNLLGRESNFSMRTFIWEDAIEKIRINPIWGNGKDGDVIFYGRQTHAHDVYIDYAAKYGLVTLSVFVFVLISIANKITKVKNREYMYISCFFLFLILFHSLFDVVSVPVLSLLFFYCVKEPKWENRSSYF